MPDRLLAACLCRPAAFAAADCRVTSCALSSDNRRFSTSSRSSVRRLRSDSQTPGQSFFGEASAAFRRFVLPPMESDDCTAVSSRSSFVMST